MWFILTGTLFLALLMFPILLGVYWYYHGKDSVLPVRQDRRRDPRYFGLSFERLFLKAWEDRKDGWIRLSRPEQYLLADGLKEYPEQCNLLVAAVQEEFFPPAVCFTREIYAWGNARFAPGTHFRAARVKGDLLLGKETVLGRWADADGTIAIFDCCDLGISVSSARAICVGRNCSFRRLYAPVIHLGAYPGQRNQPENAGKMNLSSIEEYGFQAVRSGHISFSDADDGIFRTSIVAVHSVVVDENVVIQGSLRGRSSVQLAEGAVICGNLFANQDVYLGRNSTVLGNVFTQGNVYCESGVVIGREGQIHSVVARGSIVFENDCFVYGYISNEAGGMVCPVDERDLEMQPQEEKYLDHPEIDRDLTFASVEAFDSAGRWGYRHNADICKVTVPQGVRKIPDGMFYACRSLEEIVLPDSVNEIGQFAFADCVRLKRLDFKSISLHRIGLSAFDGCSSLEEVIFPASIQELGNAAFCNCTSLKTVHMPRKNVQMGTHCFENSPYERTCSRIPEEERRCSQ